MSPKNGTLLLLILCACAGCACADRQSLRGARKLGFFDDLVAKKSYGHGCTFDGDCKSGHCIRFKCADGTKDSTCDNNGQCYAEKCAGGKCWCDAGKCATKLPEAHGCNDGAQCSSGHCIRFKCADGSKDSTCDNSGQCYAEECADGACVCDAGACRSKRANGADCGGLSADQQCDSGRCLPKMTSEGASAGIFSGGTCVEAPDYPGDVCDVTFAKCSSDAFAGASLTCSADCIYASETRNGSVGGSILGGTVGNKNIKACCIRDNDWVKDSVEVIPRGYKPSCGLNIRKDGQASNWMSTQYFTPAGVEAPADLAGVVDVVKRARAAGVAIKAVGGCASMSDNINTAGQLVHTYLLNKIERFGGTDSRLFWLETGVTIYDFISYLQEQPRRLAMPNLGGWTGQTVVGAVSTSTHGSGIKFAPLGDFVRAIHLVAGDGREYVFEPATGGGRFTAADFPGATLVQSDEEFYSAVVSFGSLGVVYRVLYEALPWFQVRQTRVMKPWSELRQPGAIEAIVTEYDHVELWLNMYEQKALVTQRQRHYDLATCDNAGACSICLVAVDPTDCAAALATSPVACSKSTENEAFCLGGGDGGACGTAKLAANCGAAGLVLQKLTSHGALTTGKPSLTEKKQLEQFEDIRRDASYNTAFMDTAIGASMTARKAGKAALGFLLTQALKQQGEFNSTKESRVQMDYQYIFDTSIANLGTVLTSEVNVPISEAAALGDSIIAYAEQLAEADRPNFYSSFSSIRFTGESKHHLAQSHGGARALMEVISGQRTSRYSANKLTAAEDKELAFDQETLVDGWAKFAMKRHAAARMHFALQNEAVWDAATIAARYPPANYASLVTMNEKYDPDDLTRNAYEARIISRAAVRHAAIVVSQRPGAMQTKRRAADTPALCNAARALAFGADSQSGGCTGNGHQLVGYCGGPSQAGAFASDSVELTDGSAEASDYGSFMDCEYRVSAPSGGKLKVEFPRFQTENNYDFVWIYDGPECTGTATKQLTGTPSISDRAMVSTGSSVCIKFHSDYSVHKKGWAVTITKE